MAPLTPLFVDLVRVETRLYNVLEARLRGAHGVSLGQFEILQIVGRGPCRVQDLADEIDITVGAISKAVDRVEAAGWVHRAANPADRRSSLLGLTDEGRLLRAAAAPTVDAELAALLGGVLTADALDDLAARLAALRRALR